MRKMKTSNPETLGHSVSFVLPGVPVAASRPKVRVHRGVGYAYYAGKYAKYLKETPEAIPESTHFFDKGTPVSVVINFYLPRPTKPANPYPVGDIDNYAKSILDAITKNGTYWHDDTQVSLLSMVKLYTQGEPRTEVSVADTALGGMYETPEGEVVYP